MQISVQSNIRQVTRFLDDVQKKQIPFAASRALNDIAFKVSRREMPELAQRVFDKGATSFTKRGFKYKKSNKRDLTAIVFIDEQQGEYMKFQVAGGTRFPNKKALLISTDQSKLNRYGNFTQAQLARIINDKQKFFKGIPKGRSGKNYEGIWERYGRAASATSGGKRIRMVARYADKAQYRPLFPFGKHTEKVVFARKGGFTDTFNRRLKQALASAKNKPRR